MSKIDPFWVRGIGLSTLRRRGCLDTFDSSDLWSLSKQLESKGGDDRSGIFIEKFIIPYFSDGRFYSDYEVSYNTLCAQVDENRVRILVEPLDTKSGLDLMWCKENKVPLYCFAFGKSSKSWKPTLSRFGIVLNQAAADIFIEPVEESGGEDNYLEYYVKCTYPVPSRRVYDSYEGYILGESEEDVKKVASKVFFFVEENCYNNEKILSWNYIGEEQ